MNIPNERGFYWLLLSPSSYWQVVLVSARGVAFAGLGWVDRKDFQRQYPDSQWGQRLTAPSDAR